VISQEAIVAEARTWIGVPFLHQGRSRNGVDCIGLVLCVRAALGPFPEAQGKPTTYSRTARDASLLSYMTDECEQGLEPEPGGIVLIQWPGTQQPSHVAICTGENIVHSYARQRRVLEVGYRAQWTKWTHSFWRIPGVRYV